MNFTIIGIDPSTTKVGVYIFEDDGSRPCVWKERALAIIPKIEKDERYGRDIYLNGDEAHYWRIENILYELRKVFSEITGPALVVVEGYSAGSYGNTDALAELGGAIRLLCRNNGIPFISPSPNQLKKFILGKGNGDKAEVPMMIAKKYNKFFEDIPAPARGDVADAYVLARIGLALYLSSTIIFDGDSKSEWAMNPAKDVIAPNYKEAIMFVEDWTLPQKEVLIKICEKLREMYCYISEVRIKRAKKLKKGKAQQ